MEDQVQPVAKSELSGPSIKELFFKYLRFLPLIIVSVALSLLVAYIYLRYATLIYRSSGSLVIQDDRNMNRRGDAKFTELFSSGTNKNIPSEIEYIKSRPVLERVVKALDLNFTYYAKGKIAELNLYKSAPFYMEALQIKDSAATFALGIDVVNDYSFRIDNAEKVFSFGEVFKNQYGVFRLIKKPLADLSAAYTVVWQPKKALAYTHMANLLVAPKIPGTGILTIVMESTNPELASDFINQLMREYQRATIEDKNITTFQTLNFIDDRLGKISHELDSVTGVLLNYQLANDLVDFEFQSNRYYERLDQTENSAIGQRVQVEVLEGIDDYLRNRKNNFSTTPSTLGLGDPTLNTLIAAYNDVQLGRKSLIDGNVPRSNVRVQQLESQIEELRSKILENLRIIKINFRALIADQERKTVAAEAKLRSLPVKQQKAIEIKRQQESKLAVYNYLTSKREESNISLAATISDIKVLEEADPNNVPVKPNRRNIHLIAFVIGLALPALFIFIVEALNDKVRNRYDVEKLTSVPIIGDVGHSFTKDTLVVTTNNRSVVAEQFRIIRSNLQYVLNHITKPVVLVTSSFSGEGKSFISTNIGAVMALTGKKTIILEFDIRKPKILSQLGIPKKPGLTNYLLGKVEVQELPIVVSGYDNLYVLACGPIPPNPAEILLDEKMNDLFTYLRHHFDIIIMDTAPVGIVSDALTLSKFVDSTLYIVRQGYTYKKQIELINGLSQGKKIPKISIILNDVKAQSGYGYYGYGNYGYGHDSGYFENDTPPPTFFQRWFGWMDIKKWKKRKKRKS